MDILKLIDDAELSSQNLFKDYEATAQLNTEKVLNAFTSCRVSSRHFYPSTGYGYGDDGRDKLSEVFAVTFGAESAIVSPHFASGTHAIMTALFGILRPNDKILCVTGMPYDTLIKAVFGKNVGSLSDYNIHFDTVPLASGDIDTEAALRAIAQTKYRAIYLQRSAGYERRCGFRIARIKEFVQAIRQHTEAVIIIDNCYGEFVEITEPTDVGADIIIGSLIKNAGGGIAPTGGYIAGKRNLVELCGMRLTAPGIGTEIGSYENTYRTFYQGFFLAPHVVCQAKKGGLLIAKTMDMLGYKVFPSSDQVTGDIVRVIDFCNKDTMIRFCQAVQAASPIDSYAIPMPGDMPGYDSQIIMASGSFIQGSSIELSSDAPIRPPYSLFIQGGITYEHTKFALVKCLQSIYY